VPRGVPSVMDGQPNAPGNHARIDNDGAIVCLERAPGDNHQSSQERRRGLERVSILSCGNNGWFCVASIQVCPAFMRDAYSGSLKLFDHYDEFLALNHFAVLNVLIL
jgi:hypothetical protein